MVWYLMVIQRHQLNATNKVEKSLLVVVGNQIPFPQSLIILLIPAKSVSWIKVGNSL